MSKNNTSPHLPSRIRICPNDGELLAPLTVGQVSVERCGTCAGVYLTPDAVARLRQMPKPAVTQIDNAVVGASRAASHAGRLQTNPRPCPNCQTLMLPFVVNMHVTVTLDLCGTCAGLWADDHELEAASIPLDPEAEVHFDVQMSPETRDAMTIALYETELHPPPAIAIEEKLCEIFPMLASWIRRTPGK